MHTCRRSTFQTQTWTRIHNFDRPIFERTDEAVCRRRKCDWNWAATELKAPFFLKIPLLLVRHICASTWFQDWLRRQAGEKATRPSLCFTRSGLREKNNHVSCCLQKEINYVFPSGNIVYYTTYQKYSLPIPTVRSVFLYSVFICKICWSDPPGFGSFELFVGPFWS